MGVHMCACVYSTLDLSSYSLYKTKGLKVNQRHISIRGEDCKQEQLTHLHAHILYINYSYSVYHDHII